MKRRQHGKRLLLPLFFILALIRINARSARPYQPACTNLVTHSGGSTHSSKAVSTT